MASYKYFNELHDSLSHYPLLKLHWMARYSEVNYSINYQESQDLWDINIDSAAPTENYNTRDHSLSIAVECTIEHLEKLIVGNIPNQYYFGKIMDVIKKYIAAEPFVGVRDFLDDFLAVGGDHWFIADMGCLETLPFHEHLLDYFPPVKTVSIRPLLGKVGGYCIYCGANTLVIELKPELLDIDTALLEAVLKTYTDKQEYLRSCFK